MMTAADYERGGGRSGGVRNAPAESVEAQRVLVEVDGTVAGTVRCQTADCRSVRALRRRVRVACRELTGDADLVGDERLVSRKVCDLKRMICAAPTYLARRGIPRKPEDLARHDCITMAGMPGLSIWPFRGGTVAVNGPATADSASAVLEMALRGMGLVRFSDFVFSEHIRDGRLVPVLVDQHKADAVPIAVVYPQSRHRVPKTAAFVDFMMRRFAHAPWRID
jgi:DNA-binding transcriptional LysR family regulator